MNRKFIVSLISCMTILLFIFSLLLPTVQTIPPISQNTIVVDINGFGDYTSINEALRNAISTDIIIIKVGTYKEHNIDVDKKVEIVGEDAVNTIIDCSGNNGITLKTSYVDLSNLQIINSGEYAIATSSYSYGSTISNCIISVPGNGIGIDIKTSNNKISNCNIYANNLGKHGVKISGSNNIIDNCNIQTFKNGVLVLINSNNNKIINSNILNTETGIDFRLDSDNNMVYNCNIYYNLLGVKIWQNSNDNLIYYNNFWRNDENAFSQNNNSWDNGEIGNYWKEYTGKDINGDGIGETPYLISGQILDNYPIVEMILPNEISIPVGLKLVSSNSNNKPSFTWSPSTYTKDILGYYVKLDNNEDIFVGDITNWTSPYEITDGIHTFYVRGEGVDGSNSGYATLTFSIDTLFIDSDNDGWSDEEEQQYGTDPNDIDNYPVDTDADRIPDSSDLDDDNDGYSDDMEQSYGTNTKDENSYPTDIDYDFIPDEDSPDGRFKGDLDDDSDGLSDTIESNFGSNPKDYTDVMKIYLAGKPYYLIDATLEGIYDILYNPSNEETTAIEKQDDTYLIDVNGDSSWDYIYQISEGSIKTYEEKPLHLPLIEILIIIIISIIIFLFIYYKRLKPRQIKTIEKLKKTIEPPPIRKPSKEIIYDKDTAEMIIQTKELLHNIQMDVQIYLDKLDQIEDQSLLVSLEDEEEKEENEEKPTFKEEIHEVEIKKKQKISSEIEEEIDKIISKLKDKDED